MNNQFYNDGTTAYMIITKRDFSQYKVLFDPEDLGIVQQQSPWHLTGGMVARNMPDKSKLLLGRLLMDTPDDKICDYLNGDFLDNRKCNLKNTNKLSSLWTRKKPFKKHARTAGIKWNAYTWQVKFWDRELKDWHYIGSTPKLKDAQRMLREFKKKNRPKVIGAV